jgi:hypothetical protein
MENVDQINPRKEALLELIHIATQHIAGSGFLFQDTCVDADFLVSTLCENSTLITIITTSILSLMNLVHQV